MQHTVWLPLGIGTREALVTFDVLTERYLDANRDLYLSYIYDNKASDKNRKNKVTEIPRNKNLQSTVKNDQTIQKICIHRGT